MIITIVNMHNQLGSKTQKSVYISFQNDVWPVNILSHIERKKYSAKSLNK